MTAPAYLAFEYGVNGGTTSAAPLPTGIQEGNLIVIISRTNTTISRPTINEGYSDVLYDDSESYGVVAVFAKTATASEVAPTITYGESETKYMHTFVFDSGEIGNTNSFWQTSSGNDVITFLPIDVIADNATLLKFGYTSGAPTSFDTSARGTEVNTTSSTTVAYYESVVAGTVAADSVDFTSNKRAIGVNIVLEPAGGSSAPSIDNIDGDNEVRAGQQNVVITGTNIENATSVTLGGETLTIV